MKITLDLPHSTHRGLIEPLSGKPHLRRVFVKRFIQMIHKIRDSSKPILKTLLSAIETDTRSTTGKNLREIMLRVNKSSIFDITISDSDTIPYFPRPEEDRWKTETLQLMMREREQGRLDDADQAVMDHLCEN